MIQFDEHTFRMGWRNYHLEYEIGFYGEMCLMADSFGRPPRWLEFEMSVEIWRDTYISGQGYSHVLAEQQVT